MAEGLAPARINLACRKRTILDIRHGAGGGGGAMVCCFYLTRARVKIRVKVDNLRYDPV